MFTLEAIKAAHAKVKSGADFPKYIQELKTLGVKNYTCCVSDGHVSYESIDGETIQSPAKYSELTITQQTHAEQFIQRLKLHQQGGTDYLTFCKECADAGIEKWLVDLPTMTCTYFDTQSVNILTENIPQA
ncbi:MAG: DUF1398 domain-containing protein [Sphingobacteriaceae bacterium]|nr:MAG: DUF1398 domain-containing protein [Sphingobacteriaceae bacterium]